MDSTKSLFQNLIETINCFEIGYALKSEADLEERISQYLKDRGYEVERQVSRKDDRYDIIIKTERENVCIELKMIAKMSDIAQFDRYLRKFKDGMIIVCWQSTLNLNEIYKNVKEQSPIPIQIIELGKMYA